MAIIKYTALPSTKKNAAFDDTNKQPHAHIMFSERIIENKENIKPDYQFFKKYNIKQPERGGYKKDDRFTKSLAVGSQNTLKVRKNLEKIINDTYEKKVWISASPASL